jgi:hypothetical protein
LDSKKLSPTMIQVSGKTPLTPANNPLNSRLF